MDPNRPRGHEPKERSFWERGAVICLCVSLLICIIILAVVPAVCVRHGCGKSGGQTQSEESINRLIVNFDTVSKTVKSLVPPLLYDYLEEQFLVTSGIRVVTFPDANILGQVRSLIESQPDLNALLQDQRLTAPPINDALSDAGASNASRVLRSLPERRALQSGATTVNYEDQLWQLPVVNYSGAWSVSQGVPSVVVAVIDTGCDLNHPDLRDNLWINTREIPNNNVDDDKNGYVDDVYGYDFAGNCANDWRSANTPGCGALPTPQDPRGHGTHCAGIVGALRNGFGTVGIAPRVKIMCLKVATSQDGTFFTSHILKAFDYALQMGAHVVSCSFGPVEPNVGPTSEQLDTMWTEARLYRTALAPLVAKNMLIVAAAGNENYALDDLDRVNSTYNPCFMARDFPDNMLCVLATDEQDKAWYEIASNVAIGTNRGTKYVDIGAPGRQIMSTVPQLDANGMAYYALKTGSSMSTPMVAGAGALILSVLGSTNGNFFQGAAAKRILLESATVLPGLPAIGSKRLNASAALRQARAALTGMKVLVTQAAFREGEQSVLMAGFNETYYAGNIGLADQDFSRLSVLDASARTGNSRFEGYKLGVGSTVVIRASVNLTMNGIYSINVSTNANASDLVVKLGQSVISPLNAPIALTVEPGWYAFELRYRNPTAAVDVRLAEPGSGLTPSSYRYLSAFYTTTPNPPRNLYYAPNIALSSAFQVLTRPNASAIRRSSILDGPFPLLQLDQPFNFSSVLEDINFNDTSVALRDALYPAASGISPVPTSVVGIAHTRIRPPNIPMRFRVTCQLCSLYINTLQVLDVYDPQGGAAANTRFSGCMSFDPDYATHDLALRFALPNTSAAALALTWVPCDSTLGTQPLSITTHVASNLLWRPSSGVAGYVSGMQCDVWPDPVGASSTYPLESQPLLKFRYPMALSQSSRSSDVDLYPRDYGLYRWSGCRAAVANESFSGNCSAAASFYLRDMFKSIPSAVSLTGTQLDQVYMRCWTYVDRGFRSGVIMPRQTNAYANYAFLGSQNVFRADPDRSQMFFNASITANQTSMLGYHQLLVMEWRGLSTGAQVGILDGTNASSPLAQLNLTMRSTLLPIPIVAQRQAVTVATPSGVGTSANLRSPPPSSSVSRGLLQATVSSTGYAPVALGSSAYDIRQVGTPGLSAVFYRPNASAPSETLPGMAGVVVNNLTGLSVLSVLPVAAGLTGTLSGPASNAGATRYMRANGFLRSLPLPGSGSSPMATYVLRVRDGDGQSIAVQMGNVTVRNAVEFPARTVTETRVELMLPAGYVPTLVTVKSSRPDASVGLDVGIANQATGQEVSVDRTLWFSNVDATGGR